MNNRYVILVNDVYICMYLMMIIFGDGGGGVSGLMKKKKDFLKNMEYIKIML